MFTWLYGSENMLKKPISSHFVINNTGLWHQKLYTQVLWDWPHQKLIYAMARTVPQGEICHGQKEIFTKIKILDCAGSLVRRKDNKPDCETIWRPSKLGRVVEEIIPRERTGSLLGEQHSPGIRETDCWARAASRKERSWDRVAKKLLKPEQMSTEEKVSLVREVQDDHGLSSALAALQLPRSTWYYHQNHRVLYTEKYAYLRGLWRPSLETITNMVIGVQHLNSGRDMAISSIKK